MKRYQIYIRPRGCSETWESHTQRDDLKEAMAYARILLRDRNVTAIQVVDTKKEGSWAVPERSHSR